MRVSQDYTYIVARMRALEASMPDRAWFQRMARSPVDSLLVSVREYFHGFEAVASLDDFESGIEAGKGEILALLCSLVTDPAVELFLRGAYDFDNLLHRRKASILGRKAAFNPFGLLDEETVAKAESGSAAGLPAHIKSYMEKLGAAELSAGLEKVEYAGESARWEFLLAASPSPGARSYVSCRIDLANIMTYARLKRTSLRSDSHGGVWIAGGEIDRQTLIAMFKEPEDAFYTYLEFTSYRSLPAKGLGVGTPMWKAEAMCRAELLDRIGDAKYRFFDLMPVIHHLETRERDAHLLRAVILGRLAGLPEKMMLETIEAMMP